MALEDGKIEENEKFVERLDDEVDGISLGGELSSWVHAETNTLDGFAFGTGWAGSGSDSRADQGAEFSARLVFEDTFSLSGVTSWVVGWAGVLKDTGALW